MCKKIVLEWLQYQTGINPGKSFTINDIYKGLKYYGKPRCKLTVWSQVVELKEKNIIFANLTIPVKWSLKLPKK